MSGGESESETSSSSRCNNTGRHSGGGGGGEGGLSLERGERGALKKGPWTSAEDAILVDYVKKHGEGNWNAVQKHSGLFRCGKSCRLRWANHLRPNLKKGAFTAEEESIIIELHAKLGNKWARMAAQLPGRTDNEIKNYWNTRIKRRQRQGLPLYPPDLHLQGDNQQNQQPNLSSGDAIALATNSHDFLTKLDIPNVTFDNYKPGGQHPLAFPSVPALSEVSMNSFLNQALGYSPQGYRILNPIHRMKRTREMDPVLPYGGGTTTGTAIPSFAQFLNERSGEPCYKSARISAPFDHQSGRLDAYANNTNSRLDALGFGFDQAAKSSISFQNPSSFIGGVGSHALLNNGTFSNSMPLPGVKLELPSSQVAESVLTSTGTPLEAMCGGGTSVTSASSPYTLPSAAPPMDCFSPHNSGLLEALLQESQALGGGRKKKQQSSSSDIGNHFSGDLSPDSKVSDYVLPSQSENGCGEYNDPITPLGGPAASIFSENTPPLSSGPWEESSSTLSATGVNPKSEEPNELISSANCGDEELSNILNLARLDVPPVSDWYDSSNTDAEKEPSAAVSDALATLFNDDFGADMQQLTSGTCSSSQASWGLGSCHWNNMPGATQIADLP